MATDKKWPALHLHGHVVLVYRLSNMMIVVPDTAVSSR